MASKYQLVTDLYLQTTQEIATPEIWPQFLKTACYNFRLSFDKQILLYAQRPEATAILPIDGPHGWNRRFGLWVNRGAKGIALLDSNNHGQTQLRYYFDIADTHAGRNPRPVPIWQVRPEYYREIVEVLENSFGTLKEKDNLAHALLSAAANGAEDHVQDYLEELIYYKEGSFLEPLDEESLGAMLKPLLQTSIGYMLLVRCGIDPSGFFKSEDFSYISGFNTLHTINVLGTATSDISQMCLSEIARTVLALQRQSEKQNRTFEGSQETEYAVVTTRQERSEEHDIHQTGRLSDPGPAAAPAAPDTPWEVRINAQDIPAAAPKSDLHESADHGTASPAPGGDSADSQKPVGADHPANGGISGSDGRTENHRPNEMGGTDEQHPLRSGGADSEGTDLRLDTQLPPFLEERLLTAILQNREATQPSTEEIGDTELTVDGTKIGYRDTDDGLLVWEEDSHTKESVFSWNAVEALTHNLKEQGTCGLTIGEALPSVEEQQFSLFQEEGEQALAQYIPVQPVQEAPEERIPAVPELAVIQSHPKPKRERITFAPLYPEIPKDQRSNFRITDRELGYGTPGEKYAANVAAIRTLQRLEEGNQLATPAEQEILSRYVGWGGLADCFEERHSKYQELKSLLSEEEYAAARASSLTAFYTAPAIIQAMYQALEQMGFREGNILEPSCGVGNFIGMLPDSMAGSHVYGVELDSISGRIAQQLYQNSSIAVTGFEKASMPDSFFDVAIGNVPFGDFKVLDKRYDKHHWLIHDYFFGKTLDKVRPGGIVAFITSKGTMDKENPAVRRYLAQRADLIGAIRLPNTAFKRNAGTEVTSDILFLQKRDHLTDLEPDWVHLDKDANGIPMNAYFVKHPEMILGQMVMESTRFGMDSVCRPLENTDLEVLLQQAVSQLHAQITEYQPEELEEDDHSIPADPEVRNFSFTAVDGKLYFRENSRMNPVKVSVTAENRIWGMMQLRDTVRRLMEYQTEDYPEEEIRKEQQRLNALYDEFTKRYGLLSSRGNSLAFGEDSSYFLLCSLEVLDEEGKFLRKADMFTKRTIRPHVAVTSVDTASEALAVSIAEKARVDLPFMAELSGKSQEELETELGGVIFRDVNCPEQKEDIPLSYGDLERYPFVTADEYLSGNVRRKLRMVKALQEVLPPEKKELLARNMEALTAVQPVDLTAGEIGVRIGVNWVPKEIYQQFLYEVIGTSAYARGHIRVLYSPHTGEWNVTGKSMDGSNIKAVTTYGTKRINAYHIFEQTLNQKDVRIYDTKLDANGNEIRVLNKKETAIAQDRQELIKTTFSEWIWKDIDRREQLCGIYNETFNAIRPREYDGQHIRFSGMNPEITLRRHQINAIAHILYGGNTLLAHEVGAGKTFEMVAAAMESKRLGLCTKSLIVVPNHITEQWAAEWLQLYPSANILVATKKDFEAKNRKKFCARIATGDYDAVIIGHSQFEKIPMSRERQEIILRRQIDGILDGIREAKRSHAENYSIKQMERTRKSLENRLAKLNDQSRKDDVVTFEQLGVDRLFVDESHGFKNLFLATKMRNVGGIAQTEAQKSSDLFMKCQYLDEITGGRGVVFATGTPISNSMVELYTIQRYLQYKTLEDMGLMNFDDWAANYGETVTAIELSPEGSGYRSKTRFAKFYNLPELMSTFKMVADIQTADMLKLPVPKANFHTEVIKPTPMQQNMIQSLADRAEEIRAGRVDPSKDNMLKITNDGRKLALDMRLVNPLAPDSESSKTSICAQNIYKIWERTQEQRSAQLAFCDLSTPKGDGSFNVYDDLKQKLMDRGVPAEEIAYIHEANTEVRKKELFAKVRSGQVRVLIGSTAKMGAGTNVQDRLIALHDLDCPWRPSDLAQRLGRIVRQGNQNPEVEIFRYVTENTFDAYLYQLVENKQKFIAQIMTSKAPARIADDVDETTLSYSEIKALATGNPLIIEKCNLDVEVGKLNMLKANHLNQRFSLENLVLRKYPAEIARLTACIAGYEKDVATAQANPKPAEGFAGMEVKGIRYSEKEAAGKAVINACTELQGPDPVPLGQYRGFSMSLQYDVVHVDYRLSMKGALSHTISLGADIYGNITRMDNLVDGLTKELENYRTVLQDTHTQLANAKAELETPFAKETELAEKSARLKELNILLNMDQKDTALLDEKSQQDEQEKCNQRRYER